MITTLSGNCSRARISVAGQIGYFVETLNGGSEGFDPVHKNILLDFIV